MIVLATGSVKAESIWIPGAFYTPETELGVVLAYMHNFYRPDDQQRRRVTQLRVVSSVTQNSQSSLSLAYNWYSANQRWISLASVGTSKFPRFFYGVGQGRDSLPDGELFESQVYRYDHEIKHSTASLPDLYGIVLLRATQRSVTDFIQTGLIAEELSQTGESTLAAQRVGIGVEYDRRDIINAPLSGSYTRWTFERVFFLNQAHYTDFNEIDFDTRHYISVGDSQVIAIQGRLTGQSPGRRPFDQYLFLGGGQLLPGIYEGQFRDQNRAVVQLAYRFDFWKWSAATVFLGAGKVSGEFGDLLSAQLHVAGGVGYHFFVDKSSRTKARIEFGVSQQSTGFYVLFDEAF